MHKECSSPGPSPWVPELGDLDLSRDDGRYEKNCPHLARAPSHLAQDDSPSLEPDRHTLNTRVISGATGVHGDVCVCQLSSTTSHNQVFLLS